jgi:outer membrane cobalamin receptor
VAKRHLARTLARHCALSVVAALALGSTVARADERTEARAHFKKGMAAIAEGQYDVGVEELQAAYAILPHPNVLFNIARAYVDMGDIEKAVEYYKRYLEGSPKDSDEVARTVAGLEARLRKQQAMAVEAQRAPASEPQAGATQSAAPSSPVSAPAAASGPPPAAPAASARDEATARGDQPFEETVFTASKSAQSPLDAPNSTSIITEQDIRLSGIVKIPELLRRLAGVDIMETTGAQTEVSMRGFNQRLSNKVLVLIDGRSVYVDLLGATLWETLPINVEDIARIEVVRGPGSALYGADAFNGVINIITRPPGEGPVAGFSAGYGDLSTSHLAVWSSGRVGELAYRMSAGYEYLPRWSREVPPGRVDLHTFTGDLDTSEQGVRMNAEVTRRFGQDLTVGAVGGYESGTTELLGVGPINDEIIQGLQTQLAAYARSKHLEFRTFWNYNAGQSALDAAPIGQSLLPSIFTTHVADAELTYAAAFSTGQGVDHDLHVGVEYRLKQVHWTYLVADELENHGGVFLHDEVKVGPRVAVVGDYRADYVPYLDRVVQSPRGSVLVHPTAKSTVRGVVATAFRTPNFLESYIGLPVQLPLTGASLVTPAHPPQLQPEQIFTTELGYLNSESEYFTVDSAIFYNHVHDLIDVSPNVPLTVGDLEPAAGVAAGLNQSAGTYPAFTGGFENQCQSYDVYGAEVGARAFPIEGLDVYANYTLMDVQQRDSGCTPAQIGLLVNDARTSKYKINGGVQVRTRAGIDGEIDVHYVSPEDWAEQVTDLQKQQVVYQSFHLDAYTLVNARVGYRFLGNHAEVSGVAFNLLDDKHREHPFGQILDRRLMAFFTYRF